MPEPIERPRPAANDGLDRIPRHHYPLETIHAYLQLVLAAPCSGRAAAWVLKWLSGQVPGLVEAPCANAGRTWLFRLGLYELTCAQERAEDWVWLVDHTVQLGSHKGMVVVGLRLSSWQRAPRPLEHADVRLLHLEPMEHSDGQRVQSELEKVVARTGVPRAIVSDGGSDLKRGVTLFCQAHPAVTHTYDIKHKMALLLKKELEGDKNWEQYVSQANLARRGLTLTAGAFLVPPSLSAKARYMNADRLVAWGTKVLRYLDHPPEAPGLAVKRQLREGRLGWLRTYPAVIIDRQGPNAHEGQARRLAFMTAFENRADGVEIGAENLAERSQTFSPTRRAATYITPPGVSVQVSSGKLPNSLEK